ncbi:MAG: aminoacyl-tRNA hydrolase [Planctomycetes bacterium]|nr:aminoacyl-tRNA hydrolase [Planctomycetota bacterium]
MTLIVNRRIRIPSSEFRFTFARSAGPGGQNVNKVNTKVTLHWSVESSPSLPEDVRDRFRSKYSRRINKQGELVIYSQRYRDQGRNVVDCLDKLRDLLLDVATAPKKRKPTRPSRASKERRIRDKKAKSQTKDRRRRPRME